MSAHTDIGWCDSTVNPTTGCDGCELFTEAARKKATCYALGIHEGRLARSRPDLYGEKFTEVRLAPGRMAQAANWPDMRGQLRPDKPWLDRLPRFIFVGDMGDIFSAKVPFHYLANEIFANMTTEAGKRHFWIVLTKRPQRMAELSHTIGFEWPDNCIAMTSVTDQRTADARVPHLMATKCRLKGISAEPILGPMDLSRWLARPRNHRMLDKPELPGYDVIEWLIVGGESGPKRRDCGVETIQSAAGQGYVFNVPTFVKQDCSLRSGARGRLTPNLWALKQTPALVGFERWQEQTLI